MSDSELATPDMTDALADIATDAAQSGDLKSDRIASAFERKILRGELPPGARLPTESELCELLSVSRTVIRDSVRTLVARGLITVRQGRGTTVAEPNSEAYSNALLVLLSRSQLTMRDVFAARATIETSLVGLAAINGTAEDWQQLESTYEEFASALGRGDDATAGAAHARFHTLILESTHVPALTLMLRPMADLTIVSSAASVFRTMSGGWELEEHLPILRALQAGDPQAATRAMEAHYQTATNPILYTEFMDRLFATAYFD